MARFRRRFGRRFGRRRRTFFKGRRRFGGKRYGRRKGAKIGPAGGRFAECQMNPFGTDTIGPKSFMGRIPDGNGSISTPVVLTAQTTLVPFSTLTWCGYIYCTPPVCVAATNATNASITGGLAVTYGEQNTSNSNIEMSSGTSCKAVTTQYAEQAMFNQLAVDSKKMRVVGLGIRVYPISSYDNTSGVLEGALVPGIPYGGTATSQAAIATDATSITSWVVPTCTAATDITNISWMTDLIDPYKVEESHSLVGIRSGISIRRPYQNEDHEYVAVGTTALAGTMSFSAHPTGTGFTDAAKTLIGTKYPYNGVMPVIKMTQMGGTTALRIEAVMHLEVIVSPAKYPGLVLTPPVDLRFPSIVAYVNSHEVVAAGHSFKSFLHPKGNKYKKRYR